MLGSFVVSFFMVGFVLMNMSISDCDRKRLSLFDLPLPSGPANPSDRLGGGSRLLPPIPSRPSQLVQHIVTTGGEDSGENGENRMTFFQMATIPVTTTDT